MLSPWLLDMITINHYYYFFNIYSHESLPNRGSSKSFDFTVNASSNSPYDIRRETNSYRHVITSFAYTKKRNKVQTFTWGIDSKTLQALSKSSIAACSLPSLTFITDRRWYHEDHRILENIVYRLLYNQATTCVIGIWTISI